MNTFNNLNGNIIKLIIILGLCVNCFAWIDVQEVKRKQQEKKSRNAPNIVFILADDLGWNDIGYHRGSAIHTPVLDALADDGVILENYYVQPICSPSRSQLMSGRYQIHTGLQHGVIRPPQAHGLPLELPTLADKLKEAGYATHMVGKWHLGFFTQDYTPTRRGFDSFYGYLTGSEGYYNHTKCWLFEGSGEDEESCGLDLWSNDQPVLDQNGTYSTRLFTARAEWIMQNHAMKQNEKPLFLYLPFQNVHGPIEVPDEYTRQYSNIQDEQRRTYAGMVAALDTAVGHVVSKLNEHDLWNNTILIFSTDNGGNPRVGGNNYPLRGWKGSHWEGGMKAVGFVTSPLLDRTGVCNELIHISDWLPTLVNLGGGSVEGMDLDGFDVWNAINCAQTSARDEILHNIDPLLEPLGDPKEGSPFDVRVAASLRMQGWKIITGNPGNEGFAIEPPEHVPLDPTWLFLSETYGNLYTIYHGTKNIWLFDIDNDPLEQYDLSEYYPDIVDMLLSRLAYWNKTMVAPVFPESDPQSDPTLHGGMWKPWISPHRTNLYR